MKTTKVGLVLSLFICSVLALGVVTALPTNAQESNGNGNNGLIAKIDELVSALKVLAIDAGQDTEVGQSELQYSSSGTDVPGCLDNFASFPTSTNFNYNAPWSTVNFNLGTSGTEGSQLLTNQFVDINGDGLNDHVYRKGYLSAGKRREESCVLLNNGSGWDIVYRCFATNGTFYGDCAQI